MRVLSFKSTLEFVLIATFILVVITIKVVFKEKRLSVIPLLTNFGVMHFSASEQDVPRKWHLVPHTREWKRMDELLNLQHCSRSPAKGLHQRHCIRCQYRFPHTGLDRFLHLQVSTWHHYHVSNYLE